MSLTMVYDRKKRLLKLSQRLYVEKTTADAQHDGDERISDSDYC